MRVASCLKPHVTVNPYTGESISVRCGHCAACLNTRAALWVQRLDNEMQCHKYTLFVTLQYDEQNVPQMVRLRKEDTPVISGEYSWSYIDSLTGQIVSFDDPSITRHSKADKNYVFNTKVLLTLNKRDLQLFIKRLRYYAHKITKSYNNIRYFITGEYGGRTYRPHAHVLLFFDSESIALHINELLSESWKLGTIYDPHFVSGSASEYVASYVNSFSDLPSIYSHAAIRQFSLFSKSPAIGTISFLREDYKRIFFERLAKIRTFSGVSNKFVDVPLWRSLQDRCFPRIPSFTRIPDSLRITLYGFGLRFSEKSYNSKTYARYLQAYYVTPFKNGVKTHEIAKYFYEISHIPYFNPVTCTYERRFSENALINFVRVVRRACVTADSYGVSLTDYVNNIVQFYEEIKKSNYLEQLKFQDSYFKMHPDESHALFFDYAFVDRCNGKRVSELSRSDYYYLKYNMIIDDSTEFVDLHLEDCFDYVDMKLLHEKIAHQTNKTKLMNDYVFKHSSKFKNILDYYKDLNDI